jgi:hypothetical protein
MVRDRQLHRTQERELHHTSDGLWRACSNTNLIALLDGPHRVKRLSTQLGVPLDSRVGRTSVVQAAEKLEGGALILARVVNGRI